MRHPTRVLRSLSTFLLIIAGVVAVAAADDAAVSGAIVDPLGARVAGATVTLLRDGQAAEQTRSDEHGDFAFANLAEGRYQIRAVADGFQLRVTDPIFVGAGTRTTIDVPLPLGPLETEVTVTAAATEILPSQVGAPITVLDATTLAAIGKPDVVEALRLVPGSSLVQTGGRGGAASVFIRGGNSNFNKVLIDGVPANDIGGAVDLSELSLAGIDRIEVLRDANSVIAGTDALAGMISITTRRGQTRVPEASLSIDGGNFSTHRETASIGGVVKRADYFSEFANFGTDNKFPNNAYRNKTYAGRFGAAVSHGTSVSGTVHWVDKYYQSPNGISLYGIPDDAFQTSRLNVIGVGSQSQITSKWQASARVGLSDQRSHFVNPTLSGQNIFGVGYGDTVTIHGANGYSATGRGVLDFGPYDSLSRSARQGLYAQTTYAAGRALSISGGGDVEREQAFTDPAAAPTTTRNNRAVWVEGRSSIADRVSVTAGLGYARIEGYASRYSPRLSVAVFLRKPTPGAFLSDTRVTFNAGKGIKATSVSTVSSSLYTLLQKTPAGAALATSAGIGPIGPERGRNVDAGIEQGRGKDASEAAWRTSTTSFSILSSSSAGVCFRSSAFPLTLHSPRAPAPT